MKIRHVPYAIAANIADEVVKVDASIITGNIRSELVNGYYPNITGLETILTPVQFRKGFSAGINTLHVNPSNRRVGIGTLTPNYTLDVSGIINASSVLINGQPIEIGVQPWYTKTDAISFKYPIGVGLGDAIPQAQLHVGRQALFEDSVSINSILKVNRIDMGDFIIKPGVLQGNWRFSNGSFSELNTISSSKITDGIGTIEAGELKGFIKINSATAKVGQINIQNNRLNNPSGNIELELVQVNNGNISNVTKLTANDIDVLNKLRIGSNPSSEKLVVDGAINIKRATNTPLAGTIQWNGSNFQGYDGSNWIDLDIQTFSAGGWTRNDIAQTVSLINTTDKIGIGTKTPVVDFHVAKKTLFSAPVSFNNVVQIGDKKISESGFFGNWNFNNGVVTNIASLTSDRISDGYLVIQNGEIRNINRLNVSGNVSINDQFKYHPVTNQFSFFKQNPQYPLDINATTNIKTLMIDNIPAKEALNYWTDHFGQYLTINKKIGIGTQAPRSLVEINDGSLVAVGTVDQSPTLNIIPHTSKMIWHPRKAAFRAGYVDGNQWDESNIGYYSTAFGRDNEVSGRLSTVLSGWKNNVKGKYSVVLGGQQNRIDNDYSVVFGKRIRLTEDADNVFVFGGVSTNETVLSRPNQFVIFPRAVGKVAIGKVNPQHRLDVSGTVNATAYLVNGNPITSLVTPWESSTIGISYSSANVGIGTSLPASRLHVVGNSLFQGDLSVSSNIKFDNTEIFDGGFEGDWRFTNGNLTNINLLQTSTLTIGSIGVANNKISNVNSIAVRDLILTSQNIQNTRNAITVQDIKFEKNKISQLSTLNVNTIISNKLIQTNELKVGKAVLGSSGQYVGVGTNTPIVELDVSGSVKATQFIDAQGNTIPTGKWNSSTAAANDIYYQSGKVGINTTNPQADLHIISTQASGLNSGGGLVIGNTASENIVIDNQSINARSNGQSSVLNIQSLGNAKDTIINNQAGNVAIGTSNASEKLTVDGNLALSGRMILGGNEISTGEMSGDWNYNQGNISNINDIDAQIASINTFTQSGLRIENASIDGINSITANSKILLGTTFVANQNTQKIGILNMAPNYPLDVSGTVNATGYLINGSPISSLVSPWLTDANGNLTFAQNVGIGIMNPSEKLSIGGSIKVSDNIMVSGDIVLSNNKINKQGFYGDWNFNNGNIGAVNSITAQQYADLSGSSVWRNDELDNFNRIESNRFETTLISIDSNEILSSTDKLKVQGITIDVDNISTVNTISFDSMNINDNRIHSSQEIDFAGVSINNGTVRGVSSLEVESGIGVGVAAPQTIGMIVSGNIDAKSFSINGKSLQNEMNYWQKNNNDLSFDLGNVLIGVATASADLPYLVILSYLVI